MSEKVLGFKKRDAIDYADYQESDNQWAIHLNIEKSKLTPVVSLEEHRKRVLVWIKKADYWQTMYEGCKKRLVEAKKEAEKK